MSNQTRTINLRNGTRLTASVNGPNIDLSYSDGTSETIPPRPPSEKVREELQIDNDNGGFIGDVQIRDLVQGRDDSIALAYSDMESLNSYIVCLCDKRVDEDWQVCEDPIVSRQLNINNVVLTDKDDNTHPSGWKFLMTVTGTKAQKPYKEERGH
jgi:hypothetical protein